MRIALLLFISLFISLHTHAQVMHIRNAEQTTFTLIKKSLPLRDLPPSDDLPDLLYFTRENESLEREIDLPINPNALPYGDDQAVQRIYDTINVPVIDSLSNWAGMSSSVDPSDNTLAVSADYVIQMINNNSNSLMTIWDKSGNTLVNKINTGDITGYSDYGDPNIIYDRTADRFIFCTLDAALTNKIVVAISETGDPTGSWFSYKITLANGLPDYPKIAVWADSYFITTNSSNPTVWALNREQMLAGATVGSAQRFNLSSFGTIGFQTASPVTFTGIEAPPEGSPFMCMRIADDAWAGQTEDKIEMYQISIDWETIANSEMSGPYDLITIPYDSKLCGFDSWSCIAQPGTTTKLHPLGNIIMDKSQYLHFPDHETIVCAHVCRAYITGNVAGIRWYELRKYPEGEWELFQQGTYAPDDGNSRFMPSVTMNEEGTMALGYNISSSTVYPSIRITGRTICDSVGIMSVPEFDAFDGTGSNDINRYGDYNNMITDPADGSFWFTANYNPNNNWKTRVVHFRIDPCVITPSDSAAYVFNDFQILPNPAAGSTQLIFQVSADQQVEIGMFDILGQSVLNTQYGAVFGENTCTLDVSRVASGNYIVRVTADGQTYAHPVSIIGH
ncbi:MAG: T9SS type A sorting domain-containing protein [Chitinophagales bacterium]